MKKLGIIFLFFVLAYIETGCAGEAVVVTRPADVVYERPASPGGDYVWVDGDWYWSGGVYVWRNGYWAHPRGGRTWVKGSWGHRGNGYYWQKGHWR